MASIKRVGFTPAQNEISNLFKALGHPARIAIVQNLIHHKVPCKYLEIELQMAKSTLSRHIQVLYDAGIIGYEKILNETYYSVNPIATERLSECLLGSLCAHSQYANFANVYFKTLVNTPSATLS